MSSNSFRLSGRRALAKHKLLDFNMRNKLEEEIFTWLEWRLAKICTLEAGPGKRMETHVDEEPAQVWWGWVPGGGAEVEMGMGVGGGVHFELKKLGGWDKEECEWKNSRWSCKCRLSGQVTIVQTLLILTLCIIRALDVMYFLMWFNIVFICLC